MLGEPLVSYWWIANRAEQINQRLYRINWLTILVSISFDLVDFLEYFEYNHFLEYNIYEYISHHLCQNIIIW